ncbi:MAG: tetratricopeptide repeat protein [Verrucomicrobia bacterium]|nr:tetratricopeptide repeat protein [Verrucomicrobiota bacterium]
MAHARSGVAERPRHRWIIALVLFLLTLAVFRRAIRNGFVNYDDDVYVYVNDRVTHGLTWPGIERAFTEPQARNWHPLTTLSHMLDCQLFGLNPAGPHAINVLLHALAAAGLFLFLSTAARSTWRAAITAGLFALHPLRVESVAWISERKDVLSAALFMATLLAYVHYVRGPRAWRMLLVCACFAAGLMAKPMLVTLPFILLLIDYWPLRRFESLRHGAVLVRLALEKLPLFLLAVLSCAATLWAQRAGGHFLDFIPLRDRICNAVLSYCIYIYQLVWPEQLAAFYPFPARADALLIVAAAAIILAGVSVLAIIHRRRLPCFFAGWFWYVIMLVPVIGVWPNGLQAHADRYTYLPQIGLLFAIVWGTVALFRRTLALRFAFAVAAALIALCGWVTWHQIAFWRDSETLWRHTLAVTTDNDVALNNLGLALQDRGDLDGALANFRAALAVLESHTAVPYHLARAFVLNNIGNNYARRGRWTEAMTEYRRSLSSRPDFANAHVNLANAFAQQGDWAAALAEYKEALRLQPADADAQRRAGIAAARLGRADDAITYFKRAIAIDPQLSDAAVELGNILAGEGRLDEALREYQRAVAADERNADAHFNLGRVYLAQSRPEDAVREYERVVALTPNDPEAHNNLANAYHGRGSDALVAAEYEKALQLAPGSVSVLNNFAMLLATTSDPAIRNSARAVKLAEDALRRAPEPHPLIFHTLAAAYAAAGRTQDAISAADHAEELARTRGDAQLANSLHQELERYKAAARSH